MSINLLVNKDFNITTVLISIIGPDTINPSKEELENVPVNDNAIKLSTLEHTEIINEKAIITNRDSKGFVPNSSSVSLGTMTCIKLAIIALMNNILNVSVNSDT